MKIIKYISLVILIAFNSCHNKEREQLSAIKNNLQVQRYPLITIYCALTLILFFNVFLYIVLWQNAKLSFEAFCKIG